MKWVSLLAILSILAGCQTSRPSFLTRVHEDCVAGDRWACNLLTSLARAEQKNDTDMPESVMDDVKAIQKGIDRAKSAPHYRFLDIPPIG